MDPDLASERQDYIELLVNVIRQELTERQRLAIVAVHFQGRSMDEVAKQLGISRNATYKLLHDARRKIKAQFEERHLGAGDIMALFEG
jgi:RNA polymerase sigma-70 factor (ECF subfamily)